MRAPVHGKHRTVSGGPCNSTFEFLSLSLIASPAARAFGMKIYSWNVNGIRAVLRKDQFHPFLKTHQPDILCLQETKAERGQIEIIPARQSFPRLGRSASPTGSPLRSPNGLSSPTC
jgi:hypothetical protein